MGKLTVRALRAVLVVVLTGTVFVQALMVWALVSGSDPEDGSLPLTPLRVITTKSGERVLRAYGLSDHPNILGGVLAFAVLLLASSLHAQEKTGFINKAYKGPEGDSKWQTAHVEGVRSERGLRPRDPSFWGEASEGGRSPPPTKRSWCRRPAGSPGTRRAAARRSPRTAGWP